VSEQTTKVVVLGAHSFSGQDFIDLLLDDPGCEVLGVSRSAERSETFLRYKGRRDLRRYRYFQLDLNTDMPELLRLLDRERSAHLVNFAAQSEVAPSWERPEDWFQTNCVALARLVNHLRKQDYLRRYLHISSPEAYGNCEGRVMEDAPLAPSTPYAASKAAADLLLLTYHKQFQFPLLIVRATNVYGARQQLFKIIPRSVIYLKMGKKIQLHGGGAAVKSYIHIRDVSRGARAILERGDVGAVYHLSPDQGVSVRTVVRMICEQMGRPFDEAVETVAERPGQDAAYVIDSTRARERFGWSPAVGLREGVVEVIDWVERNWAEIAAQPLTYQHRP
jgi:dTDP-glucose 4,6-dehydratase